MLDKKEVSNKILEAYDCHNKKEFVEAKEKYEKILEIDSENFDANHLLGILLIEIQDFKIAEKYLAKSISINPIIPAAYNNLGISLKEQGKIYESIKIFNEAIYLKNNYADAYINRGLAYILLKDFNSAIKDFNHVIKIKTDSVLAYNALALSLFNIQNIDAALLNCNISIAIKKNLDALLIRGDIYYKKKNYVEAINSYKEAINLDKTINDRLLKYIFSKRVIADWDGLEKLYLDLEFNIEKSIYCGAVFHSLNILDCPSKQKKYTEIYNINTIQNYNKRIGKTFSQHKHKKIRLGYFSSDFRSHPIGHLIVGVIENHNKDLFELYGFSLISLAEEMENDVYTKRISNSLKLIDISSKSLDEIEEICKNLEIDIVIDLNGFTQYSKPEIFYRRVAPIQINYLGYPGTLGSNMADYLICDSKIIPNEFYEYYFEKIISLPDCYQPNDDKQKISEEIFNRSDLNLPENSFVFCCFNNTLKINKKIFYCWMEILNKVQNSILWILEENSITQNNLINEAEKAGIKKDRLIFANRLPVEKHLARIKNADLFLDTYPYNAHTTAKDFLYVGVPVLTLKGKSFASRVAFSLLDNLGVKDELVTDNIEEYKNMAIEIATNKQLYLNIKEKINKKKTESKLFKTKNYTDNIEKAYVEVYNRYINNLFPDHIKIN